MRALLLCLLLSAACKQDHPAARVLAPVILPVPVPVPENSSRVPGSQILRAVVAGGDLKALIETYSAELIERDGVPYRWLSHVRGYYVAASVSGTGEMTLVGPLWTIDSPQSEIAYESGLPFVREDATALDQHPYWHFDAGGSLIRETRLGKTTLQRDRLELGSGGARWVPIGTRETSTRSREGSLVTPSGRFELFAGSAPQLYDHARGALQRDPWLERAYQDLQLRLRRDLGNSQVFLSEDLEHLVVCPDELWNRRLERGVVDERKFVRDFSLHGKSYRRSAFGLHYRRPEPEPAAFPRSIVAVSRDPAERALFERAGEPLLLVVDREQLRLHALDGAMRHAVDAEHSALAAAGGIAFRSAGLTPDGQRVWFALASPRKDLRGVPSDLSAVFWDLAAARLSERRLAHEQLFAERAGAFEPISAQPVLPP
ncbi:MAG TPA: hypothetical protein VJR89_23645 [Polyangiales bacterium]|nr:hypothetical protein [Polyangiales bacterium]